MCAAVRTKMIVYTKSFFWMARSKRWTLVVVLLLLSLMHADWWVLCTPSLNVTSIVWFYYHRPVVQISIDYYGVSDPSIRHHYSTKNWLASTSSSRSDSDDSEMKYWNTKTKRFQWCYARTFTVVKAAIGVVGNVRMDTAFDVAKKGRYGNDRYVMWPDLSIADL